jgi:hypothetical protein
MHTDDAVTETECSNLNILGNSVRYAAMLGDKPTCELTTAEFVKEALKVRALHRQPLIGALSVGKFD